MLTEHLLDTLAAAIYEMAWVARGPEGAAPEGTHRDSFATLSARERMTLHAAARRMVAGIESIGLKVIDVVANDEEGLDPLVARALIEQAEDVLASAERNAEVQARKAPGPFANPFTGDLPDLRSYRELDEAEREALRRRVRSYLEVVTTAGMGIAKRRTKMDPPGNPSPILSPQPSLQPSPQYSGVELKMVMAIIKPFKLEEVKESLSEVGVQGMTVVEMKGFGRQKGHTEVYRGSEYTVDFLPKVMLMIAVEAQRSDVVVKAIQESAGTGRIGDGKIFVLPIMEAIRIRTGEAGYDAVCSS